MTKPNHGAFVISLDVEMFWGVTRSRTFEDYGENILNEVESVRRTLQLFEKYHVAGTWCIVGFLLQQNKQQLQQYLPEKKPVYEEPKDNTYDYLKEVTKETEKYFFNIHIAELLKASKGQETGSHSFSHFYSNQCTDPTVFEEDVAACERIFKDTFNLKPTSYIFPRNQVNPTHLRVLKSFGYKCYRGNDKNEYYFSSSLRSRMIRLFDSYINLTGRHTHAYEEIKHDVLVNVPASFILRPFSKHAILNTLQKRRLKKAMKHAAKNKRLFHLWWHPHNLGKNMEQNFAFLEDILAYYRHLNNKYKFTSYSMSQLASLYSSEVISNESLKAEGRYAPVH